MTRARLPVPLPDPQLIDGPVTLRPWTGDDSSDLSEAWADPHIARWTGVPPRTDAAAARRWIDGDADRRARGLSLDLVVEVAGLVAGEVGLSEIDVEGRTAEIGWWIRSGCRGQRLASRSASLLTRWALAELDVESIVARCHPDNPPSAGVARAAGFSPVGLAGDVELWRCC